MGDLQRKTSLADKVLTRQKIQRETVHEENHTIDRVVPAAKRKNKAISARVYGNTYIQFKKICDAKRADRKCVPEYADCGFCTG